MITTILVVFAIGLSSGLAGLFVLKRAFSRKRVSTTIHAHAVIDRVRETGRLVGLDVRAKEIATSTQGWGMMPALFFTQAKVAMIFEFEKQYAVDLSKIGEGDVERVGQDRVVIHLPRVESSLRLLSLTPYDIQAGRVLGLVDGIPMNAERQASLMDVARKQAVEVFEEADARYAAQAQRSIENRLRSVLRMSGVDAEFVWEQVEEVERVAEVQVNTSGSGSSMHVLTGAA
ncbi:MAG: DUF4230 domain-containing protein [Planctomycetota bacterium]|jgi:hypothetical protein